VGILVLHVDLCHVHVDVVVYVGVHQHHHDLSLPSHLVEDVAVDLSREDDLGPLSEAKVDQDLLDLVVLVQLMLRLDVLAGVVELIDLLLTDLLELLGLHRLEGVLLAWPASSIRLEATDWDQLAEEKELEVLVDIELLGERLDELMGED